MTPTAPNVEPEGRYNTAQTAALLGISTNTLRTYVSLGKIRQRRSRTTSTPRYLGRDILQCWRAEY